MNVFIDMDGVLTDYFTAIENRYRITNYKELLIKDFVDCAGDLDFWESLPKTHKADDLLRMVVSMFGSYNILSSCHGSDSAMIGKVKWLTRNTVIKPSAIVLSDKKHMYAKGNILIDDYGKNIREWIKHGGRGFKFKAREDHYTLSELERKLRSI